LFFKIGVLKYKLLLKGDYIFESKICIGNHNCSEKIVTYRFTIQAPFWETGWLSAFFLLILGLLVYSFFKVRVLTYNKDITRELIWLLIKRLKGKEKYFF